MNRALGDHTPIWNAEGKDWIVKKVAIFCETGPFAHLPDATLDDLRAILDTLDEEQLAFLGVEPVSE